MRIRREEGMYVRISLLLLEFQMFAPDELHEYLPRPLPTTGRAIDILTLVCWCQL